MTATKRIEADDIRDKFAELSDEVTQTTTEVRGKAINAAAVIGVVVVLIVFLMGRRSGNKRSTVVEIRRL